MINDFAHTEDGDLSIIDGEITFGDAVKHHANSILNLDKGQDKFNPALGCNIINNVNGNTPREVIARNIRTELQKVGIRAKTVVVGDTIEVNDVSYN